MVQIHPALKLPANPVCSICIANYNGVELLADCLRSIEAQTSDVPIEVIVHDDASTDASVAFLRTHFPNVEVLASEENVGFCVGNNRMAEHARGEFLLLLNNDAALFPDAIQTLLDHARAQSRQGILTLPQYDWRSGDLVDCGAFLDAFYNPVPNVDATRPDVAMVIGACLWIPRSLWDSLGGFPTWIESIAEDMYLCCEARLRGWPVQTTAVSGYRHWQGKSFSGDRPVEGLRSSLRRRALSERNKTYVLVVMTPTPAMWLLLVLHCALLLLEGAALAVLRSDSRILGKIYWPAIAATLAKRRFLRKQRASMQAQRRIGLIEYLSTMRLIPQKLRLFVRHGLPHLH